MTANTSLLFGFLPSIPPGELLFALLVFVATICILLNIRPVIILGGTMLLAIIVFVDLVGMSPLLAILIIAAAALIRLIGTAAGNLDDTDPELLAALAAIIDRDTTGPDDRNDD